MAYYVISCNFLRSNYKQTLFSTDMKALSIFSAFDLVSFCLIN